MDNVLIRCRAALGESPRRLWWDRLSYLRVPKPSWLRRDPSDKLTILFDYLSDLYTEGVVVWAHIVQANGMLFEEGDTDCPGELVYSTQNASRVDPSDLPDVARALYALKGTHPRDPELQPNAEYLTDQRIRVFGLPVPRTVSPALRCKISTTFFVRKHLPGRRLCAPLLPTIVHPSKPNVALPLPAKYWPEDFADWWVDGLR